MVAFPVLLLLVAAPLVSADPVFFNVTLTCEIRKAWCMWMTIYEHDMPREHDIVSIINFCIDIPVFNHISGPKYPGGDWFGKHYEFAYTATHTCTDNGEMYCIDTKEQEYVLIDGPSLTPFDINLNNHGNPGQCPHINKKPTYPRGD